MDTRELNMMFPRMVMVGLKDWKDQKQGEGLSLDQGHTLTSVSGCLTFSSFELALPTE